MTEDEKEILFHAKTKKKAINRLINYQLYEKLINANFLHEADNYLIKNAFFLTIEEAAILEKYKR